MTERDACPECDSVSEIYERQRGAHGGPVPTDSKAYHCRSCGATFDDPQTRDITDGAPQREPARSLWLRGKEE